MSNPLTRTLNLTINLKLCDLTRSEARLYKSQIYDPEISDDEAINIVENESLSQPSLMVHTGAISPPSWAASAKGESRLEPIHDTALLHPTVDLTTKPFFRVGRSEDSDIILYHRQSSRQHALIFHDPHGFCFVVDCGSAQGTYVNGVRLPPSRGSKSLYPLRVKCGSLIRFGGHGCPTFLLKSFTQALDVYAQKLYCTNDLVEPSHMTDQNKSSSQRDSNKCATDDYCNHNQSPVDAAQLKLNTRLNALGYASTLTYPTIRVLSKEHAQTSRCENNTIPFYFQLQKRPLSEDEMRLVAPTMIDKHRTPLKCEMYNLSVDTNVPLFDETTPDCNNQSVALERSLEIKQKSSEFSNLSRILSNVEKLSAITHDEHSTIQDKKRTKRVTFANKNPSFIYPLTITPDE